MRVFGSSCIVYIFDHMYVHTIPMPGCMYISYHYKYHSIFFADIITNWVEHTYPPKQNLRYYVESNKSSYEYIM